MKLVRDEKTGNIIEVIFAEGEDQQLAWRGITMIENQRMLQQQMNNNPFKPMGIGGIGMGLGMGMMPMGGMGMMPPMGMNSEQFKEYQKQSEENFKQFQEQMARINKEAAEQMAAINRQTAQQVDEIAKRATEYAFSKPQPQNAEKN